MSENTAVENAVDAEASLSNVDKANAEIKKYIYASVAAGFVPTPLLDIAAVSGIQLKMIHSISKTYGVSFSKDIVKSAIISLLGGINTRTVATAGLASLLKSIPVVGSITGALAVPTVAGASTYAVGKIFIKHYESGGTLLNFNASAVKDHFKDLYAEGVDKVKSTVDEVKSSR